MSKQSKEYDPGPIVTEALRKILSMGPKDEPKKEEKPCQSN